MCVLHNLTFQLETEAPALFSRITALGRLPCRASSQGDTSPIGCFSQQSNKLEQEVRPSLWNRTDQSRPDKSRPDKSRPDKSRSDKSRSDKSRSDKSRPDKSRPDPV